MNEGRKSHMKLIKDHNVYDDDCIKSSVLLNPVYVVWFISIPVIKLLTFELCMRNKQMFL